MRLIGLAVALAVSLVLAPLAGEAQRAAKVPRIGVLWPVTPQTTSHYNEAFKQGLREHGYVEGQNVILERRYAEGRVERMPEIAAELVRMKVDVIVTGTDPAIAAVKRQTRSIAIVMVGASDPVGGPGSSRAWPVLAGISPAQAECPRSSAGSDWSC